MKHAKKVTLPAPAWEDALAWTVGGVLSGLAIQNLLLEPKKVV